MPSDWYVVIGGNSCGPFGDSRIKALAAEGRITPETPVCRAGMKEWVTARQIRGLFAAAPPAASPQVVPLKQPTAVTAAPRPAASAIIEETPLPTIQISTRAPRFRHADKSETSLNIMLGLGGAAALLLGFFCPVLRLPIIGGMSYLGFVGLMVRAGAVSEMTISAVLVLLAVVVAAIAAAVKQPTLFWVPGIASCLAALLTLGKYLWMQGEMASKMKADLEGNPFAGLAQAMAQAVSLDFGFGVIVIGAALVIAGAAVPAGKRA